METAAAPSDHSAAIACHTLFDRLDVPCYAPQIQAFAVDAGDLVALQAALREVIERGDLGLARKFFHDRIDRHLELLQRTVWRVPTATWVTLCELLEDASRRTFDPPLTDGPGGPLPDPALVAGQLRALLSSGPAFIDCDPVCWREARMFAWDQMLDIMLQFVLKSAAGLLSPPAPTALQPPKGDLAWVESCRFFLLDSGKQVEAQQTDPMGDAVIYRKDGGPPSEVHFEDGQLTTPDEKSTVTSPYQAFSNAREQSAFESLEELLIGPYRLSRGPGPFLPMPAAARPLQDPTWKPLPLFNPETSPGFTQLQFLVGADLDIALAELAEALPSSDWWGADSQAVYEMTLGGRAWLDFDQARDHSWEACRERYRGLLEEAKTAGGAVVLLFAEIDDQGPMHTPASAADGFPTLRETHVLGGGAVAVSND